MKRKVALIAVVLAGIGVGVAVALRTPSRAAEQLPLPQPSLVRAAAAQDQYVGVGSCASPACHGGPLPAANNTSNGREWKTSYTVWIERDPHAGAYNVLRSEQSRNMLCELDHKPKAACQPWNEPRCLACHSTTGRPSEDGRAVEAPAERVVDGVGCEACHGPARGWLAEHTARSWDNVSSKERAAKGMIDTREIGACAAACAGCHVGSTGRDMNHDMIAAGHPRLTFELSAFLANMPHHWQDRDNTGFPQRWNDPARDFAVDDPAQVWAVGQIAMTESALRLLAARAGAADPLPGHPGGGPWPELSEYDCYSCHHGLSLDGYRQKTLGNDGREHRSSYRWATWHLPLTRLLLQQCTCAAAKSALTNLDQLAASLQWPLPAPKTVARDAESAAAALQVLLSEPNKPCFDRQIVDRVLLATERQPAANWDEACGQYLLFRSACSGDSRFNAPLASLRDLLQFRDQPRPEGPPAQYLSPAESLSISFDPGRFKTRMDEIRKLLPRQPTSQLR